jgi:integrase
MSIKTRITKTVVDRMPAGAIARDTEVRGFGVRRQDTDAVYFLQKRIGKRVRWLTIGRHGSPWTPETARKEAVRLLGQIAGGVDPQADKEAEQARLTLAAAHPEFMTDHGSKLKPRTREEYERQFKLHLLPTFGAFQLDGITRAQVARFHANLAGKPVCANHCLATLSKLMVWAEETGRLPEGTNPCRGVKKYRDRNRERYLSTTELARLGEAIAAAEAANSESLFAIAAIRLLLLTGARRNEILTLRWREVDLERGALRLADSKTGDKVIKLGPAAISVLAELPREPGNPYVIVGGKPGQHLIAIQNPWERIRAAAGLEDVRLHDLRHSFASMAVAAGASLPMIGKLLGHSQPQTTQRYAHLADDPVTQLNNAISDAIATALQPKADEAA